MTPTLPLRLLMETLTEMVISNGVETVNTNARSLTKISRSKV